MECIDEQVQENGNRNLSESSQADNSIPRDVSSEELSLNSLSQNVNNSESYHGLSEQSLIPQILVNDYSPGKWEPQVVEYITTASPNASLATDVSVSNSYVTAEEQTPVQNDVELSCGKGIDNSFPGDYLASSHTQNLSTDKIFTDEASVPDGNTFVDQSSTTMSSSNDVSSFSSSITPTTDMTPGKPSSMNITSPNGTILSEDSLTPSMNSFQRDSTEPFGEFDEDYFEEYHLPNTHENAFVRHLSFRRKVQTTPIHAPDAERIEGLVRTGEFIRHGSLRKKIVPEEDVEEDYEEEDEEHFNEENYNSSSFTDRIEKGIHELERYLSEDNLNGSVNESLTSSAMKETPVNFQKNKRTASTPKAKSDSDMDICSIQGNVDQATNVGYETANENFEENVSIEDITLRKIQECLDFSTYKDILNLSGRLSDLLSPKEVEEVLNNSERYRQYLDTEVLQALSLSFQEQSQSLPCTINVNLSKVNLSPFGHPSTNSSSNKSIPNTDSGFSSPRSPKEEKETSNEIVNDTSTKDLHLVERNSAACDGIGAQGLFVETHSSNTDLRKIPAPEINLDWSTETKSEDCDIDTTEDTFAEDNPPKKRISVTKDILEISDYHDDIDIASEAVEGGGGGGGRLSEQYEKPNNSFSLSASESDISPPAMSSVPPPPDLIPELTCAEEMSEIRHWRNVVIGGAWRRIDMKVISPFRKCISHGGYMDDDSQSPLVVISAPLLPDKSRKDYHYVMDNLFMYVLSFLEQLVADDYVLIYFSGGKLNGSGPGFHWMRRAYEMIDRRIRKNLKSLLVVHPSLWARTIVTLSRPFISSKFYRKLEFVYTLTDLAMLVPLEQLDIPDAVKQADFEIMIKEKKKYSKR